MTIYKAATVRESVSQNPHIAKQTQFPGPGEPNQKAHSKALIQIQKPPRNWLCLGLFLPGIGFKHASPRGNYRPFRPRRSALVPEMNDLQGPSKIGFALSIASPTISIHDTVMDLRFVCVIMILPANIGKLPEALIERIE
jgi:hypothetical protein